MVLPEFDNLLNGLHAYWGKDLVASFICRAERAKKLIKDEDELATWVNRLSFEFWNLIETDASLSFHSTIVNIQGMLPWKKEEELFDLLWQTYEENLWYCMRGVGEAIVSMTSDDKNTAWTIGYNQFCYEIFKPFLKGAEEKYTDFKRNINDLYHKNKTLAGFVSQGDVYDVQQVIETESRRFRNAFMSYAELRKDELFLYGVKNYERNPTFQNDLPSNYSKETHSNLVKGWSPKIIPRFAYHTNVLFYYASTPTPKYIKGPRDLENKRNVSIKEGDKDCSLEILREELILRSFANLVQQVDDIEDTQKALLTASMLLNYARSGWRVYKSALRNGRPPLEELEKRCNSHDLKQWAQFRYRYLCKNVYYKYIMLLEQNQFSEITDTFPKSERAVWRGRFQTVFPKIEGLTIFKWLESLPTPRCRRQWEKTIGELYHYQHHQMEGIEENRVNSAVSQLVALANHFICAIQHFFFVNFYIVGYSDRLPPDAFLKVLDSLLDVHQIRNNL